MESMGDALMVDVIEREEVVKKGAFPLCSPPRRDHNFHLKSRRRRCERTREEHGVCGRGGLALIVDSTRVSQSFLPLQLPSGDFFSSLRPPLFCSSWSFHTHILLQPFPHFARTCCHHPTSPTAPASSLVVVLFFFFKPISNLSLSQLQCPSSSETSSWRIKTAKPTVSTTIMTPPQRRPERRAPAMAQDILSLTPVSHPIQPMVFPIHSTNLTLQPRPPQPRPALPGNPTMSSSSPWSATARPSRVSSSRPTENGLPVLVSYSKNATSRLLLLLFFYFFFIFGARSCSVKTTIQGDAFCLLLLCYFGHKLHGFSRLLLWWMSSLQPPSRLLGIL